MKSFFVNQSTIDARRIKARTSKLFVADMGEYVELFRHSLNIVTADNPAKWIIVSKRVSDNVRFCHVRTFRGNVAMKEGVTLDSSQLEILRQIATHITPPPLFSIHTLDKPFRGSEESWIGFRGDEVMLLKKKCETIYGIHLNAVEFGILVGKLAEVLNVMNNE